MLKWQPPFAPSGVKLQYRVALSNLLTPSAPLEAAIVENCSYTRYLARELSQCLKYDISVFAVNRAGESEPIKAQVSLPAGWSSCITCFIEFYLMTALGYGVAHMYVTWQYL